MNVRTTTVSKTSRRRFAQACGLGFLAALADGISFAAESEANPCASFDREMEAFMQDRGVPGGALAVVKDRKLIYARGYGWADRDKKLAATADSLFRIASISKPFTAVAVLQLVEQGKLKLTDRAFDFINYPALVSADGKTDPRLREITIAHLLHHNGGWDRDKSYDPMFRNGIICAAAGIPGPADQRAVIRYMLGQPLDFNPGERYAYSNFGYCVLGRIIEKVSGKSYEEFVKSSVLAPCGIKKMRLGATLEGKQAANEVRYYTPNSDFVPSLFPQAPGMVAAPYGGFNLEAMDAHGGWLASAVDLVRFTAALADEDHSPLLRRETIRTMLAPPAPPAERKADGSPKDYYYGCGWQVRPKQSLGRPNYWHSGSLPGTNTILVQLGSGLSWTALFNQRTGRRGPPDGAIDQALHRGARDVKTWPSVDLFANHS